MNYKDLILKIIIYILLLTSFLTGCGAKNSAEPKQAEENSKIQPFVPLETEKPIVQNNIVLSNAVRKLVTYNGPVEHIFFHPLIAYYDRAFDNDSLSTGYNDWFVTVSEFNKILDSLYKKDFILIDFSQMYEEKNENGKNVLTKKSLLLPPNKKPLIISIDDLNYYQYMIDNGNVNKLILDAEGNIATYSVGSKGEKVVAYDNEIITILDGFVKKHSDFSYKGTKGMIALTGYEGVLGYRTNRLNSPAFETERNDALKVVNRLKETGWSFASHSWGHLDMVKVSYDRLVKDTLRWKNEVEPIIGQTKVYIYPYGSAVDTSDAKFKYLLDSGFKLFCGVGPTSNTINYGGYIITDRRPVDGLSMHTNRFKLLDLFDSEEVVDAVRPAKY